MSLRSAYDNVVAQMQSKLRAEPASTLTKMRTAVAHGVRRETATAVTVALIGRRHPRLAIRLVVAAAAFNAVARAWIAAQIDEALRSRDTYGGTL